MNESELEILSNIDGQLAKMLNDKPALQRTLQWIGNKYGTVLMSDECVLHQNSPANTPENLLIGPQGLAKDGFDSFGELMAIAPKTTEAQRFLLAVFYYTYDDTEKEFRSRDINRVLQEAGYSTNNTSNCIRDLKKPTPSYIAQCGKTSKNGEIKFKITAAGVMEAKRILCYGQEDERTF